MVDLVDRFLYKRFPFSPLDSNKSSQSPVLIRVQIAECEVLHLPLELVYPKPVGERDVNLHGLLGNTLLLVLAQVLQRSHVVQSVGKLDQDHPQICSHGEEDLADVLKVGLLAGKVVQAAQLRHSLDK